MLSWKDVWVQQERYKDALREAEKQQALARSAIGRRFYCRALTWLGNQLVFWGYRLRERYGTPL